MTPELKETLRARIAARLAELDAEDTAAAGNSDTVTLDQTRVGRLSRMDAIQAQAMAKATQSRRGQERQSLQQAKRWLDDPDYGYCTDCGEHIAEKRLFLNPAIARCIDCAR